MEQVEHSRVLFREGDEILRRCSVCGEYKPLHKFYKNPKMASGVNSQCKICQKNRGRKHGRTSLTDQNSRICGNCKRCLNGQACLRITSGKFKVRIGPEFSWEGWYAKNKDSHKARTTKWGKDNPCKLWAVRMANYHLNQENPGKCARCGNGGRLVKHHPDYTDPLKVEWLCNGCHVKEHRGQRK